MKEQIILEFEQFKDSIVAHLPKIAVALLVLLIFYGLGKLMRRIAERRFKVRLKDNLVASFAGSVGKWAFYLMGLAIALYILGFGPMATSLLAGAGIGAIVIGFAFKDIAENFLAGVLLAINRPFSVNDIIEVDSFKGTVRTLNLRTTHVRMPDGRDVFIPNALMVKNVLTNYTKDGLMRQEFIVGLDTGADVRAARSLILKLLEDEPRVLDVPKPNVLLENLGVSTADVKVFFWINVFQNSEEPNPNLTAETVKSSVMRSVKDLLLANGFNLPSSIMELKNYDDKQPLYINSLPKE